MAATTAAVIGLAGTAATTYMSFKQAADARRAAEDAERKAAERMAEARERLDVNFFNALSLPKEPYTMQFEQSQIAAQAAIDAARQGEERGVAATAGRALMAQQALNEKTRADMSKELYNIQATQLEEDARLRDIQSQLDLEEAQGAALAARDQEIIRNQALAQGMQGLVSMGAQVAQMPALYAKDEASRALTRQMNMNDNFQAGLAGQGKLYGVDVTNVGGLTPMEFQNFMLNNFTPEQIRGINLSDMGVVQPNSVPQTIQLPYEPFAFGTQVIGESLTPYYNFSNE